MTCGDRCGITQVVFRPDVNPGVHKKAENIRSEYVLAVKGKVEPRPEGMTNPKLPTGAVDVECTELRILNEAETPPFAIEPDIDVNEELRLRYRYLDLRRADMQEILVLRHRVSQSTRRFLTAQGFLEIETPFLMKSTPEGARDYLVPSRINRGMFYALPQSPQTYKQLLMVAGFDRYFQIVRCFRDEDLRGDRQPEFTQIDIENVFCGRKRRDGPGRKPHRPPVQRYPQPQRPPPLSKAHLSGGHRPLRHGQTGHPVRV